MKKKVLLISLCYLPFLQSLACDVCGSGAGGGYMGILPGFRKKFISVRYLQNSLLSHPGPGGSSTYLTSREQFRVTEIWGAVNLGTKFRIAAFLPFNFMERSNSAGHSSKSGVGDPILIGYYQLLNKEKNIQNGKPLMQSLWAGGGVKLPAGKYNAEEKNISEGSQNTFQSGTGSIDFSAHVMYDIRIRNAGLNINAACKLNTQNKYAYKYGNKLTINMLTYYKLSTRKDCSFAPNAGLLLEQARKDRQSNDIKVWETGGSSLMGTIGLEFSCKRISLGFNYQSPLHQQLGEGKIIAKDRGMGYVSFSF